MTRFIRSVALTLVLLLAGGAAAEVNIPLKCRVKNLPPGRCGWCAVETLARYHHINVLYGLTEGHDCQACPEDLEETLLDRRVAYRIQYPGTTKLAILKYAIREGRGAAVGFRELEPGSGGHIVTLVDFGAEEVRVIDPNDADRHVRTMSRERFLHWWDGFALVLEPVAKTE